MIDRSTTQDSPLKPMAEKVAGLLGTRVAETILASAHVQAHIQAGHMGASDLIKPCKKILARRGPSTYAPRLKQSRIEIAEIDYPRLRTLNGAVDYLKAKLG